MEKLIGAEIRNLHNDIQRRMDQITTSTTNINISGSNVFIIGFLIENEGKDIFQKDLEKALSMSKSTCSKVLSLMENKDLIKRVPISDARFNKIVITEKGREVQKKVEEEILENENKMTNGIDKKDLEVFYRCIMKMEENLK